MLEKILKDILDMRDEEFNDETEITTLNRFDSMNHMVLIVTLENEFNIELTPNEIMTMIKIGDIKKALISKGINV